jgi:hypothetical protein
MSAVIESPPERRHAPVEPDRELPDARVLVDRTPAWLRSTPGSSVLILAIGVVFLLIASMPLWHTDLWDHLNYGRQILQTGHVFSTEPLLRLCRGMLMVDIPWLAQAGMAWLHQTLGLTALQFAAAVCVAGSLGIIAIAAARSGRSTVSGLIAAGVFLSVNLTQLLIIRPQLAGLVCYCVTAAWAFGPGNGRVTRASWLWLPALFALWANLHGSFAMGLLLLACATAGRFADVWKRSHSLSLAIRDRGWRQLLLLSQLCAAAVLLNPNGLLVYPEVLHVAGHPNVESMFEWDPLTIRSRDGQWAAAAVMLAAIAVHFSPRRLRCGLMLSLLGTGLLALWSSRMLTWWAPLVGLLTGPHLVAAARQSLPRLRSRTPREASGLWTVVNGGLLWILFALTPFGAQVVQGRVPPLERLVSRETPVGLVAWLNEAPSIPDGLAFVPAEWAGFVMNRGPQSLQPMVNLHVHVIPEQVWKDYLRLIDGPNDWNGLLDEYGINLVVVDKRRQPDLFKRIHESPDWSSAYEDAQGAVFLRKVAI